MGRWAWALSVMRSATPESWLPSPSFPLYEVSDQGRVRDIDKGTTLKPYFYRGRHCVTLKRKHRHPVAIASLVAEAFLSLTSVASARTISNIIHRNDDKTDNRPANLLVSARSKKPQIDLQRASTLRKDGLSTPFIETITRVKAHQVRRHRKRQGPAE